MIEVVSDSPGRAAETLVIKRAVVCPARFLRRRVKFDVTDILRFDRDAKGLNAAIEVFVVYGILIVIDSRRGIGDFVAHERDAIGSRSRLHLNYRRPCPSHDGRLHSLGLADRGKCEARCAANKELTVGTVVIHVALPGMRLTPRILKRIQVCRFREIRCTRIEICVQIVDINANPVRYAVMYVAGVIGRG
jgi:hypothetical protein